MRNKTSIAATLLVAVLLVAASVSVTYVVTRQPPAEQPTSSDRGIHISLIGDSYSSGLNNTVIWPDLVADGSPLAISNFALPGSGYVGGAGESGPFGNQLERAVAAKPDVIVVFGGINDVGKTPELIQQAATDLFGELSRRAPESRVVALGPLWHDIPPPEAAVVINDAVARAATEARVPFVRLIDEDWLVGDGLIQPDDIHPTDAGQEVMARELGPLLQRELRRTGPVK